MRIVAVVLLCTTVSLTAASIRDMTSLYETLFGNYSYKYRPLYNQSETVAVYVSFNLVAISEVDMVRQILFSNVWMNITWKDEFLTWDPGDYDGIKAIHPPLTDIWRPIIGVPVSLEERDLFKDDASSITVYSNGRVSWYPGTNFVTGCKLDALLFPFDVQTCEFQFLPFSYLAREVSFISRLPTANLRSFLATGNGEWTIPSSTAHVEIRRFVDEEFSFFIVKLELKRRPGLYILNIIIPVLVLSFLNILVFALPSDSGEKVSYGITCMLSLIVFISIVSGLLPKSSENLPLMTVYLTCLLGLTVLSVVATIFIVKVETRSRGDKHTVTRSLLLPFVSRLFQRKVGGEETKVRVAAKRDSDMEPQRDVSDGSTKKGVVENEVGIGHHLTADNVCLAFFMLAWLCITVGFLTQMTS